MNYTKIKKNTSHAVGVTYSRLASFDYLTKSYIKLGDCPYDSSDLKFCSPNPDTSLLCRTTHLAPGYHTAEVE